MSETSIKKLFDDNASLDEDSGHDSVDDPSSERDRIASLETAVSWIKNEVVRAEEERLPSVVVCKLFECALLVFHVKCSGLRSI